MLFARKRPANHALLERIPGLLTSNSTTGSSATGSPSGKQFARQPKQPDARFADLEPVVLKLEDRYGHLYAATQKLMGHFKRTTPLIDESPATCQFSAYWDDGLL